MLPCKQQVEAFRKAAVFSDARLENFYGVDGLDVYNPTVPFEWDGKTVIGARVEARDSEQAQILFFEEKEDGWHLLKGTTPLPFQDPAVAFVDGELVVSGIEYPVHVHYRGRDIPDGWVQRFYKGRDLYHLTHFIDGPALMKDIRLCQLKDGRLCFFTRPMEPVKGIGMVVFNSFDEYDAEALERQPVLEGQFLPEEWGGANQVMALNGDTVGIIGHKSYLDGEPESPMLHYNSTAFTVNLRDHTSTPSRIIATRSIFPDTPAKWEKVRDVVFTAGIRRLPDGKARLYTGISDCCVGSVVINWPFKEEE